MADDLLILEPRSLRARIAAVAAVLLICTVVFWAVKWQLGDMIAELSPPSNPDSKNSAELSIVLAPSDPLAAWLGASIDANFSSLSSDEAIKGFEETVRLAPADYRWRIELGRAFEQAGKIDLAEAAFNRAVKLAPTYAHPHWQLGNFYLRQRRETDAIAELRLAAANSETFRQDVFSLGWDYFDKDASRLEQLVVPGQDAYAGLAYFYAARGRAADALRIWNLLSDYEKNSSRQYLSTITQGLFEKKHFTEAIEFARQLGTDTDAKPELISNGGFERSITTAGETRFGWQIARNDSRIDVTPDSNVHKEGAKSLKVSFRGYNKPELFNISQLIVVRPNQNYRLRLWVRTENLKSAGMPQVNVIDAVSDKLVVASNPFAAGTNEWQEIELKFRTPDGCTGITVATGRAYCGDNCPLTGIFWYDGFEIERS